LINESYTEILRVPGVPRRNFFAVNADSARVGVNHTRKNFYESALPSPIVAKQRVNLSHS
jgi:hypothetical protein